MNSFLLPYKERVNKALDNLLPKADTHPIKLNNAMRYMALSNSSKRIRAALVYMAGEALGGRDELLDTVAASIEMLHIFTLIHDDLPCIDNSDTRNHKPSCHIAFDEATAILVGDSLLVKGLKHINAIGFSFGTPEISQKLIELMSEAMLSVVIGEHLDIENTTTINSIDDLEEIYLKKTTALISSSLLAGAIASNCSDQMILGKLKEFGDYIGLAFQIVDDLIEIESSSETLGKPTGKDIERSKVTYPSLIGTQQSKSVVTHLYDRALNVLDDPKYDFTKLKDLAAFIIKRSF